MGFTFSELELRRVGKAMAGYVCERRAPRQMASSAPDVASSAGTEFQWLRVKTVETYGTKRCGSFLERSETK